MAFTDDPNDHRSGARFSLRLDEFQLRRIDAVVSRMRASGKVGFGNVTRTFAIKSALGIGIVQLEQEVGIQTETQADVGSDAEVLEDAPRATSSRKAKGPRP